MARSKNVDSWMYEQDPSIRQIAQAVRDLILDAHPELKESIKWSNPVYSGQDDVFYISATEKYVNLGFFKGARLTDPRGHIEGTGKSMRHLKVRAPEDIDPGQLTAWIDEAVALDEEGRRNTPL